MKETITINLSGIAFKLDEEGYKKLNTYLTSIKNEYENQEQVEELLNDIETRIVELILNKQNSSTPVSEALISEIINQLGDVLEDEHRNTTKPDSERSSTQNSSRSPFATYRSRRLSRRLYRNPDGAMLGGVCSGVGAYFNIDKVFIRLIFIIAPLLSLIIPYLAFVSIFFSVLLYISLWLAIPRARAPRQFLEMRGEPITQKSVESYLKEEFSYVDENVSRITRSERSASVLTDILVVFGKIVKYVLGIVGCCILFGLLMSIIFMVALWFYSLANYSSFINFVFDSNVYINAFSFLFVAILPLLIICMLLAKAIFKVKLSRFIFISAIAIWLCASIYATITVIYTYKDFRIEEQTTDKFEMELEGDVLYIKSLQPAIYSKIASEPFEVDEDLIKRVKFYYDVCNGQDRFYGEDSKRVIVSIRKRALGGSRHEAYDAATNIPLNYFHINDTLFINHYFELNKGKNLFNTCSVTIQTNCNMDIEKDEKFYD